MEHRDETHNAGTGDLLARREPASGIEAGLAAASLSDDATRRDQALLILRERLIEYVTDHPIGHEFQAIDFHHWLGSQPTQPDWSVMDRRASGGLFLALVNAGVLLNVAVRNNGGNRDRNYHGTPRSVYAIASHDTTPLGWIERASETSHAT